MNVASACGLGLVGGVAWLVFWCFCGIPVVAVLIPGLVMGYLISSLLFVTTDLGKIPVLNDV